MTKNLAILGSTGSIGKQSLEVAKELNINVVALSAGKNIKLLEEQIREFHPKIVAVYEKEAATVLSKNIKDTSTKVLSGTEGLCEVATANDADTILNSVVGMVGLEPTLAAINAKKRIALANKETLVAGGKLVMEEAKKNGVEILPVDSEHSAIFQCLRGCPEKKALKKVILTASGGPFWGKNINDLKNVKKEDALKHPNWSMGAKITIDSATMMNKGLEIIEAVWLFDVSPSKIEVVVHRESVVHSLIEYQDNSVIAQLGIPSMKIPIQYSLTYPERFQSKVDELNLTAIRNLTFFEPDYKTFDCLNICKEAIALGGTVPAVVNAANEEAVKLFLEDKISFLDIPKIVRKVMVSHKKEEINSLEDILKADKWARAYIAGKSGGSTAANSHTKLGWKA
ncbi:MAG: 1-deoxy-D-xylulose 5-phosphate reductoisomerase [Eubacteriales bacterium SKADARSKE-1]|nr:1-deoxy-D-xylulose 5-phosphate reductoisomerase [Eubacteriales bacterium SKADARSKE-1]